MELLHFLKQQARVARLCRLLTVNSASMYNSTTVARTTSATAGEKYDWTKKHVIQYPPSRLLQPCAASSSTTQSILQAAAAGMQRKAQSSGPPTYDQLQNEIMTMNSMAPREWSTAMQPGQRLSAENRAALRPISTACMHQDDTQTKYM